MKIKHLFKFYQNLLIFVQQKLGKIYK